MNPTIAQQIQDEQNHGRQKYGTGPYDFAHDDAHSDADWWGMIQAHNALAKHSTPMERRQHLIKVDGLAVSAVESFDRRTAALPNMAVNV